MLLIPAVAASAGPAVTTIRGKLITGKKPLLASGGGGAQAQQQIALSGDEPTMGVLNDERLRDFDLELIGARDGDRFRIEPIHTRSMFVHKDGKRLFITYWCDVCYIRTYSPGICWCCQKETDLDLRESISD